MDTNDWRQWIENRRAGAARELAEARRNRPSAAQAYRWAMDLLRFDESLNGSPFHRDDPVTRREDEQLWNAWAKLRAGWNDGGR